jgi:hypothetical protein
MDFKLKSIRLLLQKSYPALADNASSYISKIKNPELVAMIMSLLMPPYRRKESEVT